MDIDFTDEDGDRIQITERDEDDNSTEEVTSFHPGSLPGVTHESGGNVYGGNHYDYSHGTFYGPVVGKQVNR